MKNIQFNKPMQMTPNQLYAAISEIYSAKAIVDEVDDRENHPRQTLSGFLYMHYLMHYGEVHAAQDHVVKIVTNVQDPIHYRTYHAPLSRGPRPLRSHELDPSPQSLKNAALDHSIMRSRDQDREKHGQRPKNSKTCLHPKQAKCLPAYIPHPQTLTFEAYHPGSGTLEANQVWTAGCESGQEAGDGCALCQQGRVGRYFHTSDTLCQVKSRLHSPPQFPPPVGVHCWADRACACIISIYGYFHSLMSSAQIFQMLKFGNSS